MTFKPLLCPFTDRFSFIVESGVGLRYVVVSYKKDGIGLETLKWSNVSGTGREKVVVRRERYLSEEGRVGYFFHRMFHCWVYSDRRNPNIR